MTYHLNAIRRFARIVLLAAATCLSVLAATADDDTSASNHAEAVMEQLRAANVARAALTAEQAAWDAERERIQAVKSANDANIESLTKECAEVEAEHQEAAKQVASFEKSGDLIPVHAQLDGIAKAIVARLTAYAHSSLPGAITLPGPPGSSSFDDAVRCLDASERSASSVSIDLISGHLEGIATAVKVLRVSGAAAWWVALDEHAAGTLNLVDGEPQLQPVANEDQRRSITHAIAILEGRRPAQFEVLPLVMPLALSPEPSAAASGVKP